MLARGSVHGLTIQRRGYGRTHDASSRPPDNEQGVCVAGYHLHFINKPRTRGGHTLDFTLDNGQIAISTSSELHLSLPRTEEFRRANMELADLTEQIRKTEEG